MGNRHVKAPIWQDGIIPFKFSDEIAQSPDRPSYDIQAPVGASASGAGGNRPDDVRKVQKLKRTGKW